MEAFAAGGLDEGFEAKILKKGADFEGGGGDGGPGEGLVGVEVDDKAVGLLDVVGGAAPGVELEDGHLGEGGEGFGGVAGDVGFEDAGLFIRDVDAAEAGGEHLAGVLLEEGLAGDAFGAADEGQRAIGDVGEDAGGRRPRGSRLAAAS